MSVEEENVLKKLFNQATININSVIANSKPDDYLRIGVWLLSNTYIYNSLLDLKEITEKIVSNVLNNSTVRARIAGDLLGPEVLRKLIL